MNHFLLKIITLWTTAWMLVVGPATMKVLAETGGQDVRIFYANDVNGETEPCG